MSVIDYSINLMKSIDCFLVSAALDLYCRCRGLVVGDSVGLGFGLQKREPSFHLRHPSDPISALDRSISSLFSSFSFLLLFQIQCNAT